MIMPSQEEPPGKAALRAMQEEVHKPSQEELDEIISLIAVHEVDLVEAVSAINSLTLKQVMGLIGEDEMGDIPEARARNAIRAELRQEAERIYGGGK